MERPLLTSWDELLVHQASAPVAEAATSDHRFFDRIVYRECISAALETLHDADLPAANEARGLLIDALRADAEGEQVLYDVFTRMATF